MVGVLELDVSEPERPVATFRREGAPRIVFPRRDRIVEAGQFSVAEIPHARSREKGRRFTDTAVIPLHRTEVDATREGEDVTITSRDAEEAQARQQSMKLDTVREDLIERVMRLPVVQRTRQERNATESLVDAFLGGAGEKTSEWNDTRYRQAAGGMESLVREAASQTRPVVQHWISEVVLPVEPVDVLESRALRVGTDSYLEGALFGGWKRSIMPYASFDAKSTEWEIAAILESSASDIEHWLRLPSTGEVHIPWDGGRYYPDFIAIDSAGVYWLIEGKDDSSVRRSDPDVMAKKETAEVWVRHVNAEGSYGRWRYLFVTESDVAGASGSWDLLKGAALDS